MTITTKKPARSAKAKAAEAAHKARIAELVNASARVANIDAAGKGAMAAQVAAFKTVMGDNPVYANAEGEPVVYTAFTTEAIRAACIGYLAGFIRKAGDNRDDAAIMDEAHRIADLEKRAGDDNLAWRAWATNKSRLLKAVGIKTDKPSNNAGGRPKGEGAGEGAGANDNAPQPVKTVAELLEAVNASIAAFIANGERLKAPRKVLETFHDWEVSAKLLKA